MAFASAAVDAVVALQLAAMCPCVSKSSTDGISTHGQLRRLQGAMLLAAGAIVEARGDQARQTQCRRISETCRSASSVPRVHRLPPASCKWNNMRTRSCTRSSRGGDPLQPIGFVQSSHPFGGGDHGPSQGVARLLRGTAEATHARFISAKQNETGGTNAPPVSSSTSTIGTVQIRCRWLSSCLSWSRIRWNTSIVHWNSLHRNRRPDPACRRS